MILQKGINLIRCERSLIIFSAILSAVEENRKEKSFPRRAQTECSRPLSRAITDYKEDAAADKLLIKLMD
ncbi:uncharacterized [Tachysurus ichikawai]